MPKAPRDEKISAAPKKRARKAAPNGTNGTNGIHAENGNGAVPQSVTPATEIVSETLAAPSMEEQIRARAYELYLQRNGNGGSPEQDWIRAQQEICGN